MEGLGKESDLHLARGLFLHIARGRFVHSPSPPASTDPPDSTSCPINTPTTPAISAGRWLDTAEWPTGPKVASAPYQLGQGTAGITGHCVLTLCPRSAPTLHCVPRSLPRKQHRTDNLARVITASKPARQISRPLGALALYTKVSAISGFVLAETPTTVQPRHRPSLSLVSSPSTAACTSTTAPTPRQSRGSHDAQDWMGLARRPSAPRMDHSDDHAAIGTGYRAQTRRLCSHDAV